MYAQRNYNEIQGINGKYRINQIGCYMTAYCNLLKGFGIEVSPLQFNRTMRERKLFIDVDDGIKDDLNNKSITQYDSRIKLVATGTGVLPKKVSKNTVIKFRFKSGNGFNTHFTMFHHLKGKHVWVIDSWDGQLKDGTAKYGTPLRWDSYSYLKPAPKPVVKPAPKPTPVVVAAPKPIPVVTPDPAPLPTPVVLPPIEIVVPDDIPADVAVEVVRHDDWKRSKHSHNHRYQAKEDITIKDIDGLQWNLQMGKDKFVTADDAFFDRDGMLHIRTKKWVDNNWWYGIPVEKLNMVAMPGDLLNQDINDEDVGYLFTDRDPEMLSAKEEIKAMAQRNTLRDAIVRIAGTIRVVVSKLKRNKKNKEQTT